jgi:hypothetical protein
MTQLCRRFAEILTKPGGILCRVKFETNRVHCIEFIHHFSSVVRQTARRAAHAVINACICQGADLIRGAVRAGATPYQTQTNLVNDRIDNRRLSISATRLFRFTCKLTFVKLPNMRFNV